MAEATTTQKKKRTPRKAGAAGGAPRPPSRPAGDAPLGWGTWAVIGAILVGGVVAWKLVGASYKHDVETICNGEKGSGLSVSREMSKVTQWVREHLATPEGNELYSTLADSRVAERAKKLQDEADKQHVSPCLMVQSFQVLAADSEARVDLQHLCSSLSFPKLLASEDDARLAMIGEWVDKSAKSPRTKELLGQLKQAPAGPARGQLLRDASAKLDVYTCDNAKTLEKPPPPVPTGDPIVRPYTDIQVIGGLREDDVKKSLGDSMPGLVGCYKKGIERKPDLAGRVVVKLDVDPQGKVTKDSPGDGNTLADQETLMCIVKAVREMKFPAVPGPMASILLPLELTHAEK